MNCLENLACKPLGSMENKFVTNLLPILKWSVKDAQELRMVRDLLNAAIPGFDALRNVFFFFPKISDLRVSSLGREMRRVS